MHDPPAIGGTRLAGVVLHPTSLPGPGANGTLGAHARAFIDWLAEVGAGLWQVLPLGPVHADRSPYRCQSVLAGEPDLIDRDDPVAEGWLASACWDLDSDGWLAHARPAYEAAVAAGTVPALAPVADEAAREAYVLFRVARAVYAQQPWWAWPAPLAAHEPAALDALRSAEPERIADQVFGQRLFELQWSRLRAHAHGCGLRIMGDAPIFPAEDSAEVWANRALFELDEHGRPRRVAGVPPDYFSSTGQRWGNPLYDWAAMERDGFDWWLTRFAADLGRVDWLRVDHFRGLESYWAVPADSPTAEVGEWCPAPGDALLTAVRKRFGRVPLVAEDLGTITPAVTQLREGHGLPGMKVLQFAFGGDATNPYLPHNHERACVVYTGTHDNNTTHAWAAELDATARAHACSYLGCNAADLADAMLRAAYLSVADTCVVPMQDLLRLGAGHRMNTPGRADGNWNWRLPDGWRDAGRARELRDLATLAGRIPPG